jgi:hypothetical protein
LFSSEAFPANTSFALAKGLTTKRMTEYGANHPAYQSLLEKVGSLPAQEGGYALNEQLAKSVSVLDLTSWQRSKLIELGLNTVGDVLKADENKLKKANYIGDIRARRMRNAAYVAVLEYLSG